MHFSLSLQSIFLLSIATRVLSAPTPAPHAELKQDRSGRYVVYISDDDTRPLDEIFEEMGVNLGNSNITDRFETGNFRVFAGEMSDHCVGRMEEMDAVATFEPELEFRALATVEQLDATWGLQRISSQNILQGTPGAGRADRAQAALDAFSYIFDDSSQGEGVNVYVIDTGVNDNHIDFDGRAQMVFASRNSGSETDDNGHGTHCAGTVGSNHLGVAKKANILGVKVLRADGGASTTDIISGLQFILQDHTARKNQANFKGSVVSMSLGATGISRAMDRTIQQAARAGIHFAVASGNDGKDACTSSPGNLGQFDNVISVGAIDIADNRAVFSNFGECVSVYAPGVDVRSTFISDPTERPLNNVINVLSGTSMATPHVAGLMAYMLGLNPELRDDPAGLKQLITRTSIPAPKLRDIPGDPAIIINNGIRR